MRRIARLVIHNNEHWNNGIASTLLTDCIATNKTKPHFTFVIGAAV